jgi:competence protein ComFC
MSKIKDIINKLLNAIFPDGKQCMICRNEFISHNEYGICDDCYKKLPFNDGLRCEKCGKPINNEAELCNACINQPRYFDKAYAPLIYQDEIVKLLTMFKFKNCAYFSKYISRFMVHEYEDFKLNCDVITYVPISKKTKRIREYNQAKVLAEEISKKLGIPLIDGIEKIKQDRIQHELKGADRVKDIEGTFKIKDKKPFKDKKVLIIDDILTTGATVNEISRLIRFAKPQSIDVLVFANTPFKKS